MATSKSSKTSSSKKAAAKKKTKAKAKVSKKPAKATKKASTTKKSAAKPQARKRKTTAVDPAVRQKMIEETAYYNAQQRGFSSDNAMDDWLAAEAIVDKVLSKQ